MGGALPGGLAPPEAASAAPIIHSAASEVKGPREHLSGF
jgi:hypothetical protein